IYHIGNIRLLALLRRSGGNAAGSITIGLPGPSFVTDVRRGKPLGELKQLSLDLVPGEPAIIALSDGPLHAPKLAVPARLRLGETGRLHVTSAAPGDVVRLEIRDPAGRTVPAYSRILPAGASEAVITLPLALNDP